MLTPMNGAGRLVGWGMFWHLLCRIYWENLFCQPSRASIVALSSFRACPWSLSGFVMWSTSQTPLWQVQQVSQSGLEWSWRHWGWMICRPTFPSAERSWWVHTHHCPALLPEGHIPDCWHCPRHRLLRCLALVLNGLLWLASVGMIGVGLEVVVIRDCFQMREVQAKGETVSLLEVQLAGIHVDLMKVLVGERVVSGKVSKREAQCLTIQAHEETWGLWCVLHIEFRIPLATCIREGGNCGHLMGSRWCVWWLSLLLSQHSCSPPRNTWAVDHFDAALQSQRFSPDLPWGVYSMTHRNPGKWSNLPDLTV